MSTITDGVSSKGFGVFNLTPHKIAICQLIHVFVPPAQQSVPFSFPSISHHNRLGLFLFSLTRACDDFVEPSLEELLNQLKSIDGLDHLVNDLLNSLSLLSSPDDLVNFFDRIRGVLSSPDGANVEDDQISLDPSSHLGVFLRCCILAFNLLTFEGVCHLLTNIGTYCTLPDSTYQLPEEDEYDYGIDDKYTEVLEHDFEDGMFQNYVPNSDLNLCAPRSRYGHVEVGADHKMKNIADGSQVCGTSLLVNNVHQDDQRFLRTKWQVEGFLNTQADLIERDAGSFPLNSFRNNLSQIQKLAPELHRVRYMQYLVGLHNDDYLSALDNLHSYFDYSAGSEGIFGRSSALSSNTYLGRYETALLCLGTMHYHFGHSRIALEAFTEAVRISQQNNDDPCLAYTLAAICNLLSRNGISNLAGIDGPPHTLETCTGLGRPLSTQQQLLVLLNRSLKRAESSKLISLVAFNHLELAKYNLKHVKRSLVSFGPKTTTKLRTCPIDVCKHLRSSSYVLSEFGSDGLSQPIDDGSFSTSWLRNLGASNPCHKNLQKAKNFSYNDYDIFQFDAQPNAIPASVLQLACSSYLVRATSWELYGSAPLVRINSLVHVTLFADAASSADLSLGYVKLIRHLAVFKGHKEAFAALNVAEKTFLPATNKHMQLLKLQLQHEQALHRGQLIIAQRICDEFGALTLSESGEDMEIKAEASIRHVRTLLAANQFSQAEAAAHSLFCACNKYNLQVETASVLLLLAEIHKKSENAVQALPYALASLSFCQSFNLDLLQASASLTIAELWLSLGSSHAERATDLVHKALPLILGHGGLELRARANIALAKCYLSDPSFSVHDDPESVLDPLAQAAEELDILEYHEKAAEAYYLKAIVYNTLGQLQEREEAATFFKDHIIALENPGAEEFF